MIRAFLDESSDGRILLLGGWVADAEQWVRFSESWDNELHAEPTVQYFSHHEAKAAAGQFTGWPVDQIQAKTLRLVEIICQHDMYGIVTGLNLKTHASVSEDSVLCKRQLRSIMKITHPYQWCFFSVTAAVLQVQLERGVSRAKVDFVFDEQSGLFDECVALYAEFKEQMPLDRKAIAGTVTKANDKDVAALQASDLLVGQVTTNLRLGKPELPWQKMATYHRIMSVTAYPPGFEALPDLVRALNVTWSTKRLTEIKAGRDPSR